MASSEFYVLVFLNLITFVYCSRRLGQVGKELSNDLHQVRKELVQQRVEQLKEAGERERTWNEFKISTAREIAKLGEIYADAKMADQLRQVSSRISNLEHAIAEALLGPRGPKPLEALPDVVSGRPRPLPAKSTVSPVPNVTTRPEADQKPGLLADKTEPSSLPIVD